MFMRACLANENKTLHIADVPVPRTGDYDVLVKIFATAVNRADLLQALLHKMHFDQSLIYILM